MEAVLDLREAGIRERIADRPSVGAGHVGLVGMGARGHGLSRSSRSPVLHPPDESNLGQIGLVHLTIHGEHGEPVVGPESQRNAYLYLDDTFSRKK